MAKTKALISFAATAKLVCVFGFAYAKGRFSHDAAHFILGIIRLLGHCIATWYAMPRYLVKLTGVWEPVGVLLDSDRVFSYYTSKRSLAPGLEF